MPETSETSPHFTSHTSRKAQLQSRRQSIRIGIYWAASFILSMLVAASWVGYKVSAVHSDLTEASSLVPQLRQEVTSSNIEGASETVAEIRAYTTRAREAADDPIWTLATGLPWLGPNLGAVSEVARSADDVAGLGLSPLIEVFGALDWKSLLPSASGTDLRPLKDAAPSVSSAAYAVTSSATRLEEIEVHNLLPQIANPLISARDQMKEATVALNTAADVARLAPEMMGAEGSKNYLLMIQNNAEARASGGIPGALAVLNITNGALALVEQSSAEGVGVMAPLITVDAQQQNIYSSRLGKFMQDVNLTPDFPTAASTAQAMWERKTGQRVDGVVSIDPVTLSYILDATGPVRLTSPQLVGLASEGLPTQLTGENVVRTLLSDVYAHIEDTAFQDAYFAGVAQEIFGALAGGESDPKLLIEGLTRGSEEGRVLLWSALSDQQLIISKYALSGSVAGPSISPAQFGVYFNDGTGAKMDYYVERTVQLIKQCARDGYEETTVRVTSTNKAPSDAATSLPDYVTGSGHFGVPAGSVQTNIVAYGPTQANVETASLDGARTDFAPYIHGSRPVGVLTVRLAPGETRTVEFTFGKIVQDAEPNLVVTPTIHPVKTVMLATQIAQCG